MTVQEIIDKLSAMTEEQKKLQFFIDCSHCDGVLELKDFSPAIIYRTKKADANGS